MAPNQQCPFCQLVANPEQTFDVHETEHFKAWLDINPRARGHTMVVPKEHLTSMEEIGEHVPELFEIIHAVMQKARNGLGADGVSVVLNDGEAAGQRLDHFYAQIFPRFEDEENAGAPAGAVFQPMEGLDQNDLDEISSQMESAAASGGGKPSKDGAGTDLVRSNRGDSMRFTQEQDAEDDAGDAASEQDAAEEDDGTDEDEKEKKKRDRTRAQKDHWDGESYSWDQDGAEFK